MNKKINWGIIGCGDVTEVKSGPAFGKVPDSALVAVMRRDAAKAEDYARRHGVDRWYDDAAQLISDPGINAIYIATPPDSHEAYALAAMEAGKPVYVEKPMSVDSLSAKRMAQAASLYKQKMAVAHYRREQPRFKKIKALLEEGVIGKLLFARLEYFKAPLTPSELADPRIAWRLDPAQSGGGLFHDLAPHQLDLQYYFFGPASKVTGIATNLGGQYHADDLVAGSILFNNGLTFNGTWSFYVPETMEQDYCEIIGSSGKISFSVFGKNEFYLTLDGVSTLFTFDALEHVQQPMIETVVRYFLDQVPNPCSGEDGSVVMELMEAMVGH